MKVILLLVFSLLTLPSLAASADVPDLAIVSASLPVFDGEATLATPTPQYFETFCASSQPGDGLAVIDAPFAVGACLAATGTGDVKATGGDGPTEVGWQRDELNLRIAGYFWAN